MDLVYNIRNLHIKYTMIFYLKSFVMNCYDKGKRLGNEERI
jgi:hypothetical protein